MSAVWERLANEPIQRLVASGGMGNTLKVEALSALVTLGLDRVNQPWSPVA